jgi:hypothetical protein
VDVAVTGGLVTLMLFIGILAYGFQRIGLARKACKNDLKTQRFVWALGACLFANVVAFFGITYFDQTQVTWFSLLAMIAAATSVAPAIRTQTQSTLPIETINPEFSGWLEPVTTGGNARIL